MRGRPCLIVDDMISTGGTIGEALETLLPAGAGPGPFVAATHGLLLRGAREKLDVGHVADVFVTDTVEQPAESWPRMHVVSVSGCLVDVIMRVTPRPRHLRT